MQLKNVAAVMVTAKLPPFGRTGQSIDVVVSSLGNAKSLRGGTLLMTPLKGVDSQVYAVAQGNIVVGGSGASAGGSSVKVNQLAGGRISNGAIIERELPSQFGQTGLLNLQLNEENFTLAQSIADAINKLRGVGTALPVTVDSQVNVSQPNTPFAGGSTVVSRNTSVNVNEKGGSLQKVNASASLNEVIRSLNALGATPTDLMSILQAMESAGCLRARLEII